MADLSRNNCHFLCNSVKNLDNLGSLVFAQSFAVVPYGHMGLDSFECLA